MRPDAAAFNPTKLQRPGDMQIFDVALVDLVQRGEPLRGVVLVVSKPFPASESALSSRSGVTSSAANALD